MFSNKCIQLISLFEGYSSKPYPDPATKSEPYTIGYGSTFYENGTKVSKNDPDITKERAASMLLIYLNKIVQPTIDKVITAKLNQNQIDALGCLIYNIGSGRFAKSQLAQAINKAGDLEAIKKEWLEFNKGGGKVLSGLVKRRAAEFELFSKPM